MNWIKRLSGGADAPLPTKPDSQPASALPPILGSSASSVSSADEEEKKRASAISDSIAALARSHRLSTNQPVAPATDGFDQSAHLNSGEKLPPPLAEIPGSSNSISRADATTPAESKRKPYVSKLLYLAFLVGGALVFWLSFTASGYLPRGENTSFRIGNAVGLVCIWPLIVIGLFSIGRRFRTPRTRIVITLVIWGLAVFAHLGTIARHTQQRRTPVRSSSPASLANTIQDAAVDTQAVDAIVPGPAVPSPSLPAPSSTAEFDFSPGSDERLAKTIESAHETRYRAIVTAYAQSCAARPRDVTLALERVRFIDRFAFSEDFSIEGSEQDRAVATTWLTTHFPDEPGTILYQLNHKYGPEFPEAANEYNKSAEGWPPDDHAKFLLLRAQRTEDKTEERDLARRSFEIKASIEAGLLILANAEDPAQRKHALGILDHPVLTESIEPWQKKQILDFLFNAGEHQRAVALYEELKTQSPTLVQTAGIAKQLAESGLIPAAREVFASLPDHEWDRADRLRGRFEFELEHGDAQQAATAYKEMCAADTMADLFLRDRFSLLLKHPGSGWSFHDAVGLIATFLLVMILLLAPAVVLLPVHYWSLLRTQRSKPSAWNGAKWGLREVWSVVGILFLAELMVLWVFAPDQVRAWANSDASPAAVSRFSDSVLLTVQGLMWAAMAIVLMVAVVRARAWQVMGAGHWKAGRIVGIALASALGLRIALGGYVLLWPGALEGELASFTSETRQLGLALLNYAGPAGLIAALAVLVPVLEELLFRGILLQGLARHIPFGSANLIQASLFAVVHENLRLFPFFLLFGVTCGLVARRSGGLLAAITIHGVNNLLVCIGYIATHPR